MSTKFLKILLIIYTSTLLIYWLPGLPPEIFRVFKIAIISMIVLIGVLSGRVLKGISSSKIIGIFFIFIILSSLPGGLLSTENPNEYFQEIITWLFSYLTFAIGVVLWRESRNDCISIIKVSYLIACFLSILCILNYFGYFPDLRTPFVPTYETGWHFYEGGFAGVRTGWSGSLALFAATTPIVIFRNNKNNKINSEFFLFIIFIAPILGAQFLSGGRGGLLATVIGFSIFCIIRKMPIKYGVLVFIFGLTILYNQAFFATSLRLDRYDVTAGRVEQYKNVINNDKILIGWGANGSSKFNIQTIGKRYEVHNVWLKAYVDYGLFHFLIVIFYTFYLIKKSIKKMIVYKNTKRGGCNQEYNILLSSFLVLITICVTSMFEPGGFLGGFQNKFLFWFLLGNLVTNPATKIPEAKF